MVKVIETNLSIDKTGAIRDHQSRIVEVLDWDTYCKEYENYDGVGVEFHSKSTMPGATLMSNCLLTELIYDDIHLSCIIEKGIFKTKRLAYKVISFEV